jgi:hypothetical protein
MVPLAVGGPRHDQDVPGAELDAEAAALATLLNDANNAQGNLDALAIQRLSPECHGSSSPEQHRDPVVRR